MFAKLSDTDQAPAEETADEIDAPTDDVAEQPNRSLSSKRLRIDLPEPEVTKPNYFWTWRLLADGYSPSHLCQVRQLDEETVFSHAIVAIENKLPAQQEWLLNREKIQAIQSFVNDNPSKRTSELLSKLPRQLKPHELIFYLKCQNSS